MPKLIGLSQILQAMPQPVAGSAAVEEKVELITTAPDQATKVWIPPIPDPSPLQPAKAAVYAMLINQVTFLYCLLTFC